MRFMLTEALQPGMRVGRDIIFGKNASMLYKGTLLTEKYITRLRNGGYYGVYVTDPFSEEVEYGESVDQRLYQKGVEAVEAENIGSIMDVAAQIVSNLLKEEEVALDLFDLRSYDTYTFFHSMNVAVCSAAVGRKLELTEEDLNILCLAALTHDFGKRRVPKEIINKRGKLTDAEYEEVKKHPSYTYDMLYQNPNIPAKVRQAVLCHHENENGSGYPFGKAGDEIPLFAKIIHAVDVYDALTSKRSYKEPYPAANAFEYLIGGKNILFDEKIVDTMLTVIPMYPPGTEVLLSNGEKALVVAHSAEPDRPIIKVFETGVLVNLEIDSHYMDIYVVKSGAVLTDYVNKVEQLNENRGAKNWKRETIMVVDDSAMSLASVEKILGEEYHVCTFTSGVDAICYIKENGSPDLIIMDIEMPGLNGMDTIRALEKRGNLSAPFIFFTATCDREVVILCKELGAVDYIVKPVRPVYLAERVAIALKRYRDV